MTLELTESQRQALASSPTDLRLVDPVTRDEYALVLVQRTSAESAESDDGTLDSRTVGLLIERNMREDDADDPLLEGYQHYRT